MRLVVLECFDFCLCRDSESFFQPGMRDIQDESVE